MSDRDRSGPAAESLDDASLCWLESLSLDAMPPDVRRQWEGLLTPTPTAAPAPTAQPRAPARAEAVSPPPAAARAEPAPVPSAPRRAEHEGIHEEAVEDLVRAYRHYGHLIANLDPLSLQPKAQVPELEPATWGLDGSQGEMPVAPANATFEPGSLNELIAKLWQTYCDTLTVETNQKDTDPRAVWLYEKLEQRAAGGPMAKDERLAILKQLTAAEELERYLGRRYPGAKRFGLEGAESLIPLLDAVVYHGAEQGAREICIGMAHRGRLNVLVNLFGKPTEELFAEFDGISTTTTETGDVKYHQGFSSNLILPSGHKVHLSLSFNPSHLEAVGPVVEGSVRARQDRRTVAGGDGQREVVPILLHGDAAFSGQGVVMETLQLSTTPAYGTGGTVHVVVNNQIGYTTSNPADARSTRYCSDISRMISAPVLRVNADDPEAVVFAANLAIEYRYRFFADIVVELFCYRRLGHNEADEPAATQPLMYRAIRQHPSTRQLYAEQMQKESQFTEQEIEALVAEYRKGLEAGAVVTVHEMTHTQSNELFDWTPYLTAQPGDTAHTALNAEQLKDLTPRLTRVPDDFTLHRQVERLVDARGKMLAGETPLDWGCAEMLTYGSLLQQGYPIRFTGQDSRRGTFTHRHSVLFDQETGREYSPLAELAAEHGSSLSLHDSLLSEEAVLGFEYGYSATWPTGLVIWEAQFGDFANGGQVMIDQFIVSGEQKWSRLSGLVLLLPHGHEGQGPEHSSARLERFLQMCARDNIQICMPSTPAQLFHLLRRQAVRPLRKPLVVMTPKSLLRLPASTSPLDEFTAGRFTPVLDDPEADPNKVRRLLLCSGRIYYPLRERRQSEGIEDTAIVRLEQLYPFPYDELTRILRRYSFTERLIWCQEDPSNQGAWHQMRHRLYRVTGSTAPDVWVQSVTRESAAAPAVGWPAVHARQEEMILRQALPDRKKQEQADKPDTQ